MEVARHNPPALQQRFREAPLLDAQGARVLATGAIAFGAVATGAIAHDTHQRPERGGHLNVVEEAEVQDEAAHGWHVAALFQAARQVRVRSVRSGRRGHGGQRAVSGRRIDAAVLCPCGNGSDDNGSWSPLASGRCVDARGVSTLVR
mmetsp:Transcript_12887/g.28942  ORF Transcript_12887/g.28942 Transcript_12887/m.28942 type:complete len:147 (-) Transcript_12887:197-637(-)